MADATDKAKGQTITVAQAAALLNRSPRWVQNLAKDGFISKASAGRYTVVEVVRGALAYYENLLEKTNKTAAASRATDARTREIELRIAERRGQLMPIEDFRQAIAVISAAMKAELVGFPARVTRDLTERKKLEAELDATFDRIAASLERSAGAVAAGRFDMEAEQEA